MDFLIERQDYVLFARRIQQRIDILNDCQRAEISKQISEKIHESKITVENISRLALGFSLIQRFNQKPETKLFPTLQPSGPGSDGAFTLTADPLHGSWLHQQTEPPLSRSVEEIIEQAVMEYTGTSLHAAQS